MGFEKHKRVRTLNGEPLIYQGQLVQNSHYVDVNTFGVCTEVVLLCIH